MKRLAALFLVVAVAGYVGWPSTSTGKLAFLSVGVDYQWEKPAAPVTPLPVAQPKAPEAPKPPLPPKPPKPPEPPKPPKAPEAPKY